MLSLQENVTDLHSNVVDLAREISHTPGTDPRVEIAMLKQALESKERKVESLQVQVQSFEGIIKHTKEQSKQVIKLKQELAALKVRLVCIHTVGIPQIECMLYILYDM